MSKTTLYEVNADGKAYVIVAGRFQGQGTSDPLYPIANPPGWTVAHTGVVGKLRVTFADRYSALVSMVVSLECDGGSDTDSFTIQTGDFVQGANPYIDIYTDEGTTNQDLPATVHVNFVAIFQNTAVRQ